MMTVRSQFHGHTRSRTPARTIASLAGAIALAAVSAGGSPVQAARAATLPSGAAGPTVKYYVVHDRHYLQSDFLRLVAARTLGDARLAPQIFSLNVGRLQPDGKRLENGSPVDPGWILILPPAAHGPLVHFGPLPLTGAAAQSTLTLRATPPVKPAEAAGGSTGSGTGFGVFLGTVLAGPAVVAGVVTFLLTRRSRRPAGRHQMSSDPDF